MKKLEHKVALVTGAARGIGNAIAVRLAQEGADVVIFDLCPEEAGVEAAQKIAEEQDVKALFRRVDVSNYDAVQSEVKSLIIRYYPPAEDNNLLYSALYDLFVTERDFATHCDIEDAILFPLIRQLEKKPVKHNAKPMMHTPSDVLSNREKDVLICIVKGLQNKEIADQLFLSVHTVITHRKNISRKLGIHSPSGLTVYAIANHLVDISNL